MPRSREAGIVHGLAGVAQRQPQLRPVSSSTGTNSLQITHGANDPSVHGPAPIGVGPRTRANPVGSSTDTNLQA
jgi:hypothetical protein